MKKTKKFLCGLLAVVMLVGTFAVLPEKAEAAWSSDWQNWSQGQSSDSLMRQYGCWVVAQAKLLKCTGVETSASFTPDSYKEWEYNNGHLNSNFYQLNGWDAPVNYSKQKSILLKLDYTGSASTTDILSYMRNGKYIIAKVTSSGGHWVFMNNDASLSNNALYCYESWNSNTTPGTKSFSSMGYSVSQIGVYSISHTHTSSCGSYCTTTNSWRPYSDTDKNEDGSSLVLGTYKQTDDSYARTSQPYSETGHGNSEFSIGKNNYVAVYGAVKNDYGNVWYKIRTSNGTECFGYSSHFSLVESGLNYLDVNGYINGKSTDNISGYGTCDVYIGGNHVAQNTTDYYKALPKGTTYTINNIKAVSGKTYSGNSSYSGTINSSTVWIALTFNDVTHTHSFDTYVYYWTSHPHYKCYKCSCGEVKEDRSQPIFLSDCEECLNSVRPSKPAFKNLSSNYNTGDTVTFSWDSTNNTTHYNLWLHYKNNEGNYTAYMDMVREYKGNELSYVLPAGEYKVWLLSYNSNYWEIDNSDWLHTRSEIMYFTVADPHVHTPSDPIIENRIEPVGLAPGSYDMVVYCSECGEELSRETIVIPAILYGDANGDGAVSINDVILIRKYLAELDYDTMISTVEISPGADANGDGTVNINDVVLLRKYLAEYDYDTGSSSVVLGPQ